MSNGIIFTREKRDQLRKAYNEAVANKQESFLFEGQELVTGYAKYLLEYLDQQFPINPILN